MRIAVSCLPLLGVLAGSAWAQTDGGSFGGEVPSEEVGLEEPGRPEGRDQLGEVHTVEQGDTLWDLSTRFLNTPWYWPKVWSYNPQLTNPHWIFPGNEVRFYPGDENLPTAVDVSSDLDFDDDDLIVPGELDESELVQTTGDIVSASTLGGSVWTAYKGFLDAGTDRLTGRLVNSFSEAYQLDLYDRVYLDMEEPAQVGGQLGIYRRQRRINHPVTGANLGWAVELVGKVEVTDNSPSVTGATITEAYQPVFRGDFVGPLPENWGRRVEPAPNSAESDGFVVETVSDVLTFIGEHHLVYLDQGRENGVQIGNTFTVLDKGDGYTRQTEDLPYEPIGEIMVIDVQETGSTAIVMTSVRAVRVGDRVAMRAQ